MKPNTATENSENCFTDLFEHPVVDMTKQISIQSLLNNHNRNKRRRTIRSLLENLSLVELLSSEVSFPEQVFINLLLDSLVLGV